MVTCWSKMPSLLVFSAVFYILTDPQQHIAVRNRFAGRTFGFHAGHMAFVVVLLMMPISRNPSRRCKPAGRRAWLPPDKRPPASTSTGTVIVCQVWAPATMWVCHVAIQLLRIEAPV